MRCPEFPVHWRSEQALVDATRGRAPPQNSSGPLRILSPGHVPGDGGAPGGMLSNARRKIQMNKRNAVIGGLCGLALLAGGAVLAQRPVDNISPRRHPNLAAAQRLSTE